MKAYMEGGTNDGQALEIGAPVPQVTVRSYAYSALARDPKPGEAKRETYQYAGRTHNAGLLGVLPVYALVSVEFEPAPPSRGQLQEMVRKMQDTPTTVIAGDEVPPP